VSSAFNHHCGGSPTNIRLSQEKRVARNFGLTGFSLQQGGSERYAKK